MAGMNAEDRRNGGSNGWSRGFARPGSEYQTPTGDGNALDMFRKKSAVGDRKRRAVDAAAKPKGTRGTPLENRRQAGGLSQTGRRIVGGAEAEKAPQATPPPGAPQQTLRATESPPVERVTGFLRPTRVSQDDRGPGSAYVGGKHGDFASIREGRYEGQRADGSRFSGAVDKVQTRDLSGKLAEIGAATEAVRDLRNAHRAAEGSPAVGQRRTGAPYVAHDVHADQWNARMAEKRGKSPPDPGIGRRAGAPPVQQPPDGPGPFAQQQQERAMAEAEFLNERAAEEGAARNEQQRDLGLEAFKAQGRDYEAGNARVAQEQQQVFDGLAKTFGADTALDPAGSAAQQERGAMAQSLAGRLLQAYPGQFNAGQVQGAVTAAVGGMVTRSEALAQAQEEGGDEARIEQRASELYALSQQQALDAMRQDLGMGGGA